MLRSLIVCLLIFTMLAIASDDAARHKERMDTAQDLKEDLKDALDAKSKEKAAEPAGKLIELGQLEEQYWKDAQIEDAVKLAQQNLAAARAIASSAQDGQFDRAQKSYETLETACRTCHDRHFEKRVRKTSSAY